MSVGGGEGEAPLTGSGTGSLGEVSLKTAGQDGGALTWGSAGIEAVMLVWGSDEADW